MNGALLAEASISTPSAPLIYSGQFTNKAPLTVYFASLASCRMIAPGLPLSAKAASIVAARSAPLSGETS